MMMMIRDDGGSFDLHKLNKEAKYTHTHTLAHIVHTHKHVRATNEK